VKTITFINEKGGVGKTTQATHAAAGLALMDYRVLLIDADAQAHSTQQLQVAEAAGLYNMLVRDANWADTVVAAPHKAWAGGFPTVGELLVLPSNIETRSIMSSMGDDVMYLRECLEELEGRIDVVVIDTSPTPSLLHSMIYLATDYVIFPSVAEVLSLDGLKKSKLRMDGQNKMRTSFGLASMELLGVQPTMVNEQTNAHRFGLSAMREAFGNALVWEPIPVATVWRDAGYAQETLYAHAPEHAATYLCWSICDRIEKKIMGVQHGAAA